MAGLQVVDDSVAVTVGDESYLIPMKRELEVVNGLEGDVDEIEPDSKRIRLEIENDGSEVEEQHIIQEVTGIEDNNELQVEESQIIHESQIIQDPQEVALSDGVVIQEEVVHQQPAPQYQNLIIQHMDIAEPLSTLKQLLELRLQCSLSDHQFYLQDSIPLDTRKSLVDQCVQGDGMVQINLEVKSQPGLKPKINILDILKPAEEVEATTTVEQAPTPNPPAKVVMPVADETENITRWIVDQNFRREQERLKIPYVTIENIVNQVERTRRDLSTWSTMFDIFIANKHVPSLKGSMSFIDPVQWSEVHVKHWIQWAVREFSLEGVDISSFNITGQELCDLTHTEFVKFIPNDRGDIFWTHLELLRKCKFVAVMQQPAPHAVTTITVSSSGKRSWKNTNKTRSPRITGDHGFSPGNRTGNNGQIQLWQFLLELLTDKDCREVIQWIGDEGEFKLNNPELVAQMWGQRKNKPTMNYEKLSRALRYYYDGDMIAKVHGKRFVYKFVCDLKMLLGYSAGELNRQVSMCAEKKLQRVRETLRPTVTKQKVTTQTVQTSLE